jgi:hypothetical protein
MRIPHILTAISLGTLAGCAGPAAGSKPAPAPVSPRTPAGGFCGAPEQAAIPELQGRLRRQNLDLNDDRTAELALATEASCGTRDTCEWRLFRSAGGGCYQPIGTVRGIFSAGDEKHGGWRAIDSLLKVTSFEFQRFSYHFDGASYVEASEESCREESGGSIVCTPGGRWRR